LPLADLIPKVKAIQNMAELSAQQRRGLKFGQQLLESSRQQVIFWSKSEQQKQQITISMMKRMPSEDANAWKAYRQVMQKLHHSLVYHGEKVDALNELERLYGILSKPYSNRRQVLIAWNRGTEQFLQSLVAQNFDSVNLDREVQSINDCYKALTKIPSPES